MTDRDLPRHLDLRQQRMETALNSSSSPSKTPEEVAELQRRLAEIEGRNAGYASKINTALSALEEAEKALDRMDSSEVRSHSEAFSKVWGQLGTALAAVPEGSPAHEALTDLASSIEDLEREVGR